MSNTISYRLGRTWGRLGGRGKLIAASALLALLASPYLAFQYAASRTAHAEETERARVTQAARINRDRELARRAALTPEQLGREDAERVKKSKEADDLAAAVSAAQAATAERQALRQRQLQLAAAAVVRIKGAMKDPQAFTLTTATLTQSGTACYEYRAKNSFGAVLPSSALLTSTGKILVAERDGNAFVRAWNKDCTVAGAENITRTLQGLL